MTNQTEFPKWLWVVSLIALLWFLMDLSAFVMRVFFLDQMLDGMPQAQYELYMAMPNWVNIVFSFEAIGGFVACIGLIFKKAWSVLSFCISLFGTLAQTCYIIFLSDAVNVMGTMAIIMPLIAITICVVMIFMARMSKNKSWLV